VISASRKTGLDPYQAGRVDRAREVLTQRQGTDTYSLAVRVGQLEWWVGDLLALIDALTASADGHSPG
jgi:hypothetical protein